MIHIILNTEYRLILTPAYLVSKVLSHRLPLHYIGDLVQATHQDIMLAKKLIEEIEKQEHTDTFSFSVNVANGYIVEIDSCVSQRYKSEFPYDPTDVAIALADLSTVSIPLS